MDPQVKKRLLQAGIENASRLDHSSHECACVCLAKDEAPYLHEYIHHHLYFGFSKIIILINRTTDKSLEVLNKICTKYPNVSYANLDWVDYMFEKGDIQHIGYAYGMALLRAMGKVRYALLSDADEFWFPIDFSTKVSDWIKNLPRFDQVSICWAKQQTHESPFEVPFANEIVQFAWQVKSIVDIYSRFERIHMHRCIISGSSTCLDTQGISFKEDPKNQFRYSGNRLGGSAYILHRMQRSYEEYVCSVFRGNPGRGGIIKTNRSGYLNMKGTSLCLPSVAHSSYTESLLSFVNRCDLSSDIDHARQELIERYREHMQYFAEHPEFIRKSGLEAILNKVS